MGDGSQKEITCRLDYALWEALHEEAHARRLSKNQAVIQAINVWLKKAPTVPPVAGTAPPQLRGPGTDSTGQTQEIILERLDLVAERLTALENKIATLGQSPIPAGNTPSVQLEHGGEDSGSGVPAHITAILKKHGGGAKRPRSTETDRPAKPGKAPGSHPGRRAG